MNGILYSRPLWVDVTLSKSLIKHIPHLVMDFALWHIKASIGDLLPSVLEAEREIIALVRKLFPSALRTLYGK